MVSYDNPLEEIRGLLEKTKSHDVDPDLTPKLTKNSSISSEKMLINYSSDSPRIFHTTLKDIKDAQVAVETKLSDGFTKALPVMLIIVVAMAGVVGVSQMPMVMDSVAKNQRADALNAAQIKALEEGKTSTPSTEVNIVYLTPEEAAAQGIQVEDTPPGIIPDAIDRGEEAPLVNSTALNPVPADVTFTEEEIANNQRTEGFDVLGNLSPKIVPFDGGHNANNQKTCDLANGYTRHWVDSSQVPNEWKDKIRDRSSQWVCLTPTGYTDAINGDPIQLDDIGTYEVR